MDEIVVQELAMNKQALVNFQEMIDAGYMKNLRLFRATLGTESVTVLCAYEDISGNSRKQDFRWHLSIAGVDDVPSWRALSEVAHAVRPGVTFVLGVPPRQFWVNVHPNVLHLWQTTDANLEAQWVYEGRIRRDTPS